jgi:16S rRNA (uracil1498-N3)-methyltransferase
MSSVVRVPLEHLREGECVVAGEAAHYLTRVHRLRAGQTFVAFDPEARCEADAEVLGVERGVLRCRFATPTKARVVGEPGLTLVQCVAKGEKLDEVVRAATALGVSTLVIAESARSVARSSGNARLERLRAVALDAARQSGRGDLPALEGPAPLGDVLSRFTEDGAHKLALEPGAPLPFARALSERGERPLVLLVGPEGGFSPEELASAGAAGFLPTTLGTLVLRTELAGIAALGAVLAARG